MFRLRARDLNRLRSSTEKLAGENQSQRYLRGCKSIAENELILGYSAASSIGLLSRLKHRVARTPDGEAFIDVDTALPAIKFGSAGTLHAGRRFCALGSGGVDFSRINIIADAMYHRCKIGQLRMSVNNFATHSQKQLQCRLTLILA